MTTTSCNEEPVFTRTFRSSVDAPRQLLATSLYARGGQRCRGPPLGTRDRRSELAMRSRIGSELIEKLLPVTRRGAKIAALVFEAACHFQRARMERIQCDRASNQLGRLADEASPLRHAERVGVLA